MNYDIALQTLDGQPASLADYQGHALLVVNVASRCGLTPQYAGLQSLYERFRERGFFVLGFPCNQFGGQEPGTHEEIAEFCTTNYSVTFPMFAKLDVNGVERHPLYQVLTATPDADQNAGDVEWNFEKFLITAKGRVQRFRPGVKPDDPALVGAVEAALPVS